MYPLRPPDPPLRDGDLLLRPSRPDDVADLLEVYSEPDTQRWMGWRYEGGTPTEEDIHGNIERAARAWEEGTWAPLGIVEAPTDRVVGGVVLRLAGDGVAEVAYFLHSSARGRGLATRAVRLICRWGFDELGLCRIELRAHPENVASHRVAERAGFTLEGVERRPEPWPSGDVFDPVLYALVPRRRPAP